MPRTIVTEDGSTIEVPTDEELSALKESAAKAAELQTKVEQYEKDPIEKNWRELRASREAESAKAKKLEEQLATIGKQVKDDGTLVDAQKPLSYEEIEAKARLAARSELVGQQKRTLLSKYDEEKKKVVEHYLTKLTYGEEVTMDNLEKYVKEAELLADPTIATAPKTPIVRGQPPILTGADGKRFSDTEAGKSLANEIFGNDSFAKQQ
jgi:hypothetical protein